MEKRLEQGYTFQELASMYKMDEGLRKHLESMYAQIQESGSNLRIKGKKSESERRLEGGGTTQSNARLAQGKFLWGGQNGDLSICENIAMQEMANKKTQDVRKSSVIHQYAMRKILGVSSTFDEQPMK